MALREEVPALWVEKYRPRKLDDIVNQREVVERLKKFAEEKNIPHLLFVGPPGTGKTTAALCLVYELYGEAWRQNVLELNASDERGIQTIRERVKDYAKTVAVGDAPFKTIILDECDAMTSEAQWSLRRIMEMFWRTTRFILIANYGSKIIEPIQSRCAIFRFSMLSKDDVVKRIGLIASLEGVEVTEAGLEAIWYIAGGDLRRAINLLQAAAAYGGVVDDTAVYRVAGKARPAEIQEALNMALKGDVLSAKQKVHDLMINYGLTGTDIIRQMHVELFKLSIPEHLKVEIEDHIAEVDYRLVEGANEDIQLSALLAQLARMGRKTAG
ncbi:MAG: replication factor C small subunit [Candidatus Nezhaarchaeota archaeon]|nr:replication factor C small subunit [Candidatus Nezhaarchaeota archaeon]